MEMNNDCSKLFFKCFVEQGYLIKRNQITMLLGFK